MRKPKVRRVLPDEMALVIEGYRARCGKKDKWKEFMIPRIAILKIGDILDLCDDRGVFLTVRRLS